MVLPLVETALPSTFPRPLPTNVTRQVPYEENAPVTGFGIDRLGIGSQTDCPLHKSCRLREHREQTGY